MSLATQEFERLVRHAEDKAASFDPQGLSAAVEQLGTCLTAQMGSAQLGRADIATMHARLISFQALCGFLQDALQDVLMQAAQTHAAPVPYGAQSRNTPSSHVQPLLRRYA